MIGFDALSAYLAWCGFCLLAGVLIVAAALAQREDDDDE